jgi:hypothetical protein
VVNDLRGKCPLCCPDGGARFRLYGSDQKQCQNCGNILPFRRVKATGKITRSQQQAIDRLLAAFGGSITNQKMIGRNVWVEIENPARDWIKGDMVYGTIGVRGGLDLSLSRVVGSNVLIKNEIDVRVYLNP